MSTDAVQARHERVDVLDHVVWSALAGPLAGLAVRRGRAARLPAEVSPFCAVEPGSGAWDDLARLMGPGGEVLLADPDPGIPRAWERLATIAGVQLVDDGVVGEVAPEVVALTRADVPEMLDLTARTQPGPFLDRTIEMGSYLGVRDGGGLVAMAGERMRVPGWTEISAVCTADSHRGRGLASTLVRAVVAGIRERGDRPMLHTGAANTGAIRLYEELGFRLRRELDFASFRVPGL
ncbi:GNAT family N-acetyltransferase [Actinokineospora pegani]|uniref:GNAT family N-acetyltransferase n=1 Tax=Actinokineospora pegani TaxID=2654637 RepID=UPI001F309303|nr:GNAT family N-acetyltransferase [Actinokineospora pegani]